MNIHFIHFIEKKLKILGHEIFCYVTYGIRTYDFQTYDPFPFRLEAAWKTSEWNNNDDGMFV